MKKYRLYWLFNTGPVLVFEGIEIHEGYAQENAQNWANHHCAAILAEELCEDGKWHHCGTFRPERNIPTEADTEETKRFAMLSDDEIDREMEEYFNSLGDDTDNPNNNEQ